MKTNIHFLSYLAQFFLEWEMYQTKVVEEIKIHTLCSITTILNRAVYEIMWKNIVFPEHVTDDNMAHAHCMLDT
jgi:hypothetical protein